MFNDYLSTPSTYKKLENHIKELFIELVISHNIDLESFITPFYKTTFSNGTPFMDANPIFSVNHQKTGSILKIVLDENLRKTTSTTKESEIGHETSIISAQKNLTSIKIEISKWLKTLTT
ncbi:hypothetical protein [Pseudomonas orientalis]|uniref:hypothetical protein n=1 Tax=Pseudomonas orientalis TaxID=76758 RepID=UPI000F583BF1|nr:hypothetical protein [Pseudomonas orientalis]